MWRRLIVVTHESVGEDGSYSIDADVCHRADPLGST